MYKKSKIYSQLSYMTRRLVARLEGAESLTSLMDIIKEINIGRDRKLFSSLESRYLGALFIARSREITSLDDPYHS